MESRSRPWQALLISALVHVGIACVLVGRAGGASGGGGDALQPGRALTVSLISPVRPAQRAGAPVPALQVVEAPAPAEAATGGGRESDAGSVDAGRAEHHYFGAGEVTQQAVVAEGLVGDGLLVVPGMLPQTVALQVWINDEGTVDRVELESALSEADQQRLLAAFAKVRFLPGRIGHISVHSRVAMKILVDYAIRA